MRFAAFRAAGRSGLAAAAPGGAFHGRMDGATGHPGNLGAIVAHEALTLSAGDVMATGTPSGVGLARKPPLWMQPGDVVEVEVEGLGVLRNPIADEAGQRRMAA